jgi:hypothetical protein
MSKARNFCMSMLLLVPVVLCTRCELTEAFACVGKAAVVSGDEWQGKRLRLVYDIHAIAAQMRSHAGYKVVDSGYRVDVRRTFDDGYYGVLFEERQWPSGPGIYFQVYSNELPCDAHDSLITGKIRSIIDDLPLQPTQKKELKSYVIANTRRRGGIFVF